MRNPEEFFLAFSALLYSWGGDTPVEATWAANKFIDYLVIEYNLDYHKRFYECPENEEEEEYNESIIPDLKNLLRISEINTI